MTQNPKADEVAAWMLGELTKRGTLYQEETVYEIHRRFGKDFTYENENGNLAIAKHVLKAFRDITGEDVIWETSEKCWRQRQKGDLPGRKQD